MNPRIQCPQCDSRDTERVHVEWAMYVVEEVRICNNCATQYTNELGDIVQRIHEVDD